jgi:hypothetical protein
MGPSANPIKVHWGLIPVFLFLLILLLHTTMKFHRNSQPPHVKVCAKIGNKGKTVEICVEDNGIGFDERYLDNSVSSGGMWHQIPLRSAGISTIRSTPSDRPASSPGASLSCG